MNTSQTAKSTRFWAGASDGSGSAVSLGAVALVMLAEIFVDGLAAGEAFVDAVPPGDGGLAKFPAQVNFAALEDGGEIDEANVEVLHHAAEFLHLFDDAAESG